jgi:hypothetical protein
MERIFKALSFSLIIFFSLVCFATFDNNQNPHFDAIDEGAHFDYVVNLKNLSIPSWGTQESQKTLRIGDCLGATGGHTGDCSSKSRNPLLFDAAGGYSYEAQQPPLGYIPFILSNDTGPQPLETLKRMRTTGTFFWSTLIACLVFTLIFFFDVSILASILLSTAIILLPTLTHALSTVTNDTSVFVFAFVWQFFLYFGHSLQKRRDWLGLIVTSVLLGLDKGFNFLLPLSFLLIAMYQLSLIVQPSKKSKTIQKKYRLIKYLTFSSVITCASYLAFFLYQNARSKVPSSVVLEDLMGFSKTSHIRLHTLLDSINNVFTPYIGKVIPNLDEGSFPSLVNLVFIAAIGLMWHRNSFRKNLDFDETNLVLFSNYWVWSGATCLLIMATFVPLYLFFQGHFDFNAPPRYGLLAMPAFIFAIGISGAKKLKDVNMCEK